MLPVFLDHFLLYSLRWGLSIEPGVHQEVSSCQLACFEDHLLLELLTSHQAHSASVWGLGDLICGSHACVASVLSMYVCVCVCFVMFFVFLFFVFVFIYFVYFLQRAISLAPSKPLILYSNKEL